MCERYRRRNARAVVKFILWGRRRLQKNYLRSRIVEKVVDYSEIYLDDRNWFRFANSVPRNLNFMSDRRILRGNFCNHVANVNYDMEKGKKEVQY